MTAAAADPLTYRLGLDAGLRNIPGWYQIVPRLRCKTQSGKPLWAKPRSHMVTLRFWSSAIYLATSHSHAFGIVGPRHDHMAIIHRQAIDKQAVDPEALEQCNLLGNK